MLLLGVNCFAGLSQRPTLAQASVGTSRPDSSPVFIATTIQPLTDVSPLTPTPPTMAFEELYLVLLEIIFVVSLFHAYLGRKEVTWVHITTNARQEAVMETN